MSLILNIDTSTEQASVCLSQNGNLIQILNSKEQKEHASFIQPAINKIFQTQKIDPKDISAVAVTEGPGSYTGLRVGMATAKGLCYALNIPLIVIGTLEVMTVAAFERLKSLDEPINDNDLFCPMIDARRQEVFTALLNTNLEYIQKPSAIILSADTLIGQLNACKIFFYGSGCLKFKALCVHKNAQFIEAGFDASHMLSLSHQRFSKKNFANLAYSEPFYGKEFYSASKI